MTDFKQTFTQLKKFIAVGAISTVINYGVFFLLYKAASVHYALAAAIGFGSGLLFGYVYNRSWTFERAAQKRALEIFLYGSVYIFSLILNLSLLNMLVRLAGLDPLLANIAAMAAALCSNFLGLKFIVFSKSANSRIESLLPLFNKTFLVILGIKLISGALFGSRYITDGFVPFVSFFSSTFQNPYAHFIGSAIPAFPYPGGMLMVLGLPFSFLHWALPVSLSANIHLELMLLRLPLLFFDVLIYILLCKLLPTKEKKVLWLYFASPIVFYINYFYGQLDVVPTAIFFLSLYLLIKKQDFWSFALLGLAIASKTHIVAVIPFYLIYMYRNRVNPARILNLCLMACAVFLLFNPYLFSSAFLNTVFNNPEQQRLLFLAVQFNFNQLKLFVAPAVLLVILFKFTGYKKLNTDSLVLVSGLIFTVLVALVPPTVGWYYWAFPFLVFFFIKYKDAPKLSLWAVNLFFLLYFIFSRDSDIFSSLLPTFPSAGGHLTPYQILGSSAVIFENLMFTGLETSLAVMAFWNYRVGSRTTDFYQKKKEYFLLGIAGDSGVGKSTLTRVLEKTIGKQNLTKINGDDIHKWERGDARWQETSHLNPKANWIHTDFEHAQKLLNGEAVERVVYDHSMGKFAGPVTIWPNKFIIFQGLMPFLLEQAREIHDLKIYMEADEDVRLAWKTERDSTERKYNPKDVQDQINRRRPDAEKFIHPQKDFADWIIRYAKTQGGIAMEYQVKNSVGLDALIAELGTIEGFSAHHSYNDAKYQKIYFSGNISQQQLENIAYKLYPNIYDLVENQPVFENGLLGIHQLFFIHYLDHFFKIKFKRAELP